MLLVLRLLLVIRNGVFVCTYQLKPHHPHPGEVWGIGLGVGKKCDNAPYRWFSRYVIAAMLVDENRRFLISSFCSFTSNCTLQHCYLCPWRLVANHLYMDPVFFLNPK